MVPSGALPQPSEGVAYEPLAADGDTALSLCFLRQPVSTRATGLRIHEIAIRAPVTVEGRPASLLIGLALTPLLARAVRLFGGLPTHGTDLELGTEDGRQCWWRARSSSDGAVLSLAATPGVSSSREPGLAAESAFHALLGPQRPVLALARGGRVRQLRIAGGIGRPSPARVTIEETSWLETLFPDVDDWEARLVSGWFVTPTPPRPAFSRRSRALATTPC